jgi:hypothetical protein
VTATGAQVIPVDKYTVNYYLGTVAWIAPYAPAGTVFAAFKYIAAWTQGDGTNAVFRFQTDETKLPIVDGSVIVCKRVDAGPIDSVTKVDTGWTVDLNTGTLTFTTAPAADEFVGVYYQYDNAFTSAASNFAAYSADQASAMGLAIQYNNLNTNPPGSWLGAPFSTAGTQDKAAAAVLAAQAATKYAGGDFAGAKADYQSAVDKLNAAYTANSTLSNTAETTVADLLTKAGPVADAYAAKLNAEAKQANGEASMDKNIGVFYIMLGVATLLAGLAGLLWAYSRLVAARGPRQA